MANIKVNDIKPASADIKPAGAELFGDSESFINDLSDNELEIAGGSLRPTGSNEDTKGCGETGCI